MFSQTKNTAYTFPYSCQSCGLPLTPRSPYPQPYPYSLNTALKTQKRTPIYCENPNNGVSVTDETDKYRVFCEVEDVDLVKTEFVAETQLPTVHGKFRLRGYRHSIDGGQTGTEPVAVIMGEIEGGVGVKVRVHDACFTSEVLGSMKCDCAQQLELALNMIQDDPPGMLIYLQQEGRGIGLANKIAAYKLQEEGLDTVDANRALGLPDDCREYTSVVNILKDLNIQSIKLMTNNPRKIDQLRSMGIEVVDRIPVIVEPGKYNQGYLDAKRTRMDHQLDGSFCWWNHEGEPGEPSLFNGKQGMRIRTGLNSQLKIRQFQQQQQQQQQQQLQEQNQQSYQQQDEDDKQLQNFQKGD